MISGLYVKLIAAAVIAAAVVGGYLYVRNLKSTVEEQKAVIIQKEANIKQLSTAIEEQNAAIDRLQADAASRLKAAEEALKLAKAEAVRAKGRADALFRAKPKDPSDLCKSALDLVNGGAQ